MVRQVHIISGVATAVILEKIIGFNVKSLRYLKYYPADAKGLHIAGLMFMLCVAGAVFPDIDSFLSRLLSVEEGKFYSHRGTLHSLGFILLVSISIVLYGKLYYLAFSAGLLTHWIMDCFTISGVPYGIGYYPRVSFSIITNKNLLSQYMIGFLYLTVAILVFVKL